ncbi:hypothetical protein BH11CYA1_BH11CYA1_06950 [soil metagenome]
MRVLPQSSVQQSEAQGEDQGEDQAEEFAQSEPENREHHPQVVAQSAGSGGADELGDFLGCVHADQRKGEADDEEYGHGIFFWSKRPEKEVLMEAMTQCQNWPCAIAS